MSTTVAVNAIDSTFDRVRAAGELAFIPYLTAGYPDLAGSLELGGALAAHGADVIEIGIPFSDPMGDGPTIQRSSSTALANGMTVRGALELARELGARAPDRGGQAPLVAMGYYNPIMRYGPERFCRDARAAGLSGLIVPDLPVEESDELRGCCSDNDMHLIYLLAPTSTEARIAAVAARASGFIYCMAVTGITGARSDLSDDLTPFLARVRAVTDAPLVVGFGISRPEHVARLRGLADGVVVASALIDLLDRTPVGERAAVVGEYVERMKRACCAS